MTNGLLSGFQPPPPPTTPPRDHELFQIVMTAMQAVIALRSAILAIPDLPKESRDDLAEAGKYTDEFITRIVHYTGKAL